MQAYRGEAASFLRLFAGKYRKLRQADEDEGKSI